MSDGWILCTKHKPDASLRLVCAPNAGAGILTFRAWASGLPAEVWCVHLPGRDGRPGDPDCASLEHIADRVAAAIGPLSDRPVALFGHSMGALIVFEVARRMESSGRLPAALALSGRRAPSLPPRLLGMAHLPTEQFLIAVRERYPYIPEAVLTDPELSQFFLPTLRMDLAMVEAYRYQRRSRLSCPVLVYGGTDDSHTTAEELQGWSAEAAGPFVVRTFPGNHSFIETSRAQLLATLSRDLTAPWPSIQC
jgi:surfactin synthase thioesterase subunit